MLSPGAKVSHYANVAGVVAALHYRAHAGHAGRRQHARGGASRQGDPVQNAAPTAPREAGRSQTGICLW